MATEQLLDLLLHGSEERNLEYKTQITWADAQVKGKLTRSLMAMANLRDGGALIIGRAEDKTTGAFDLCGLADIEAETFRTDDIASFVNEYASPMVELKAERVEHDGKYFIVVQVREFVEIPVVCRKDGAGGLRRGAIYTRSRRMNETVEVSNEAEMREILEMAGEKAIRRFYERASRAGVRVVGAGDNAEESFRRQLGGL